MIILNDLIVSADRQTSSQTHKPLYLLDTGLKKYINKSKKIKAARDLRLGNVSGNQREKAWWEKGKERGEKGKGGELCIVVSRLVSNLLSFDFVVEEATLDFCIYILAHKTQKKTNKNKSNQNRNSKSAKRNKTK